MAGLISFKRASWIIPGIKEEYHQLNCIDYIYYAKILGAYWCDKGIMINDMARLSFLEAGFVDHTFWKGAKGG